MLQQTQAFLPLRYRFGRRDIHFLAFIHLAAAMIWMRRMSILPNSGALTKPRVATDAPRRPRRRPPVRRLGQGVREFPRLACMRSTKSPPVWLIVAASWTRWFRAISAEFPRNLLRTSWRNHVRSGRNDDIRARLRRPWADAGLRFFQRCGRVDHVGLRDGYRLIGCRIRHSTIPLRVDQAESSFSRRIGRSRTRTPVAWNTALATAALTPTLPSSPRPLTPSGLTQSSVSGTRMTSIVWMSAFTGIR